MDDIVDGEDGDDVDDGSPVKSSDESVAGGRQSYTAPPSKFLLALQSREREDEEEGRAGTLTTQSATPILLCLAITVTIIRPPRFSGPQSPRNNRVLNSVHCTPEQEHCTTTTNY